MNRLSGSAKYTHSTFAERVGFLQRSPFGRTHGTFLCFAERVGFEPTVPLRIHYLSRVANSTTLASLRYFKYTESRIFFQWPGKYFKFPNLHRMQFGGRGGIRTLDSLAAIPVFETGRFNHSRTLPSLVSEVQIY